MPILIGIAVVGLALRVVARRGWGSPPLYLGFWLVLAVLFGTMVAGITRPRYRTLAARGVRTEGTVTALIPENHRMVRCRYEVRGKSYEEEHIPCTPNPPMEALQVGQKVVVVYDPANPSTSALGDPKLLLASETKAVIAVAVFAPTVLVLSTYWEQRRARRRDV